MFHGTEANFVMANDVVFDSLTLDQNIITDKLNTKIIDTIFSKCKFTSSSCRCIYHSANNFHLERVFFHQLSNAQSSVYITTGYDKNIDVTDYSSSLSNFRDYDFVFKEGGFLTMKQTNYSSSKAKCIVQFDNMIKLVEYNNVNVCNCSASQYLLAMDSEPADKKYYKKYVSYVNVINSQASQIIFVASEYTLERFCLMNNTATNTIILHALQTTIVNLVDFWINSPFSSTGRGDLDKSGLKTGERKLLIIVNTPRRIEQSCRLFPIYHLRSLAMALMENRCQIK